ncbi:GatB/YqeY domain-containing protein [Candidatus Saccharibacteria bacterium]|nr:GatB/YqeY domain-containing protein [Candidatus Saccharibacteria bacterium]
MKIKKQLEADLKTAMLAGEKNKVTTLRGLKSSILNAEVAEGSREAGLSEEKIISVFSKEAKKRQEAADLYTQAGNNEKAQQELVEKQIIAGYLPKQMSEAEIQELVTKAANENNLTEPKQMGQLIAAVKQESKGAADGSVIARFAKEQLSK